MEALPKLDREKYTFGIGRHRNQNIIWVSFSYDLELAEHLKAHTRAYWSRSTKKWYVTDNDFNRQLFGLPPQYHGKDTLAGIAPINRPPLKRYVEQLQLKGYSPNTIKTYSNEFIQLLKALQDRPVEEMTAERLRSYILYCINTLKLSENLIHSRLNALKFYFEQVLHREKFFMEIPRPKKPSILPKALSANDIRKMFKALNNSKHRLLLKLCYGMGLRVSELVNLRITDIDSDRMQVLVRQGKGKKDRYVILPETALEQLQTYYREFRPKEYLFEGQNGGPYSVRSVQQVFKNAMQKAKINKKVGVHSLRHSFATHLIEQGVDIRFVQDLMGHSNIKTTMIYTGLTDQARRKIKSPLDNL